MNIVLTEKEDNSAHHNLRVEYEGPNDGIHGTTYGRNMSAIESSLIIINSFYYPSNIPYAASSEYPEEERLGRIKVVAHEIGHLFWLRDDPRETSIMEYELIQGGVNGPTWFDRDSLLFWYGNGN